MPVVTKQALEDKRRNEREMLRVGARIAANIPEVSSREVVGRMLGMSRGSVRFTELTALYKVYRKLKNYA